MSEYPSIKVKIDVSKIDKTALFKGEKGTYLDLVLWPNRDGVDQYGNDYAAKQSFSKERRDRGDKEPYIGNGKVIEQQSRPAPRPAATTPAEEEDDIPF